MQITMHTKLTLRLDEKLIERAKSYSKESGKSVSQVVADYFALLEKPATPRREPLAPLTRSLHGSLRGAAVDEDDYRRHLEEKYR